MKDSGDWVSRIPSHYLLLAVSVGILLRVYGLGYPDLVGGDEGYYGTYAKNILETGSLDQILNLSRDPLGPPDNKPFVYPLILAAFIKVFGANEWAIRLPSVIADLATIFLFFHLLRILVGQAPAAWSAMLMAVGPTNVYFSRTVMGEPTLTLFGVSGLLLAVSGLERRRTSFLVASGVIFGLGFLVKLWLIALLIVPFVAYAMATYLSKRDLFTFRALAIMSVAFVPIASTHLVLVYLFSPSTLEYWIDNYWVFSLTSRIGGEPYASYWFQSPWYYFGRILTINFFAVPFLLLGLQDVVKRVRISLDPGAILLATWAAGLFLISVPTVKIYQYALPLMPAIYGLEGIGAHRLWDRFLRSGGATYRPYSAQTILASSLALVVVLGSLAGSGLAVRKLMRHRTHYREVAKFMEPYLTQKEPGEVAFVAPEAPSFFFYTFRKGIYWSSPYEPLDLGKIDRWNQEGRIVFYVVNESSSNYGGEMTEEVRRWLHENGTEVTKRVASHFDLGTLNVRVFLSSRAVARQPQIRQLGESL